MSGANPEKLKNVLSKDVAILFGEKAGRDFLSQLELLVNKYQAKLPPPMPLTALPLTERDSLLITYGDQVKTANATPLQTLAIVAERHLRGVVSGIHILPFYPWTSDDGFSVKDYFAVDPALGTWGDVRALGTNFDLMFDAVFNHMSAQSEWFQKFLADDPEYRDFFVTVDGDPDLLQVIRPRALPLLTEFQFGSGMRKVWTTFSADQVDLNVRNPKVLLALIDALLFYVANGAKFIRLDAIAFFWKEIGTCCLHLPQTHRVIQLMRSVLNEVGPGTMIITETNVPHVDNISYFGDGTNEAQLVYNFALPPLVLHSIATGNAEKLTGWAQSLKLPSDRVTFFNFLASHDGIGLNPARGILTNEEIDALVARTLKHGGLISYKHNPDGSRSPYEMNINYFDALSNPLGQEPIAIQVSRFICAQAIMFALAGVPGIYFHSLFGSRGDIAGAKISEIPRRINRQKITLEELDFDLADASSLRARVFTEMRRLLQARATEPAFSPLALQEVLNIDPRIFAVERTNVATGRKIFCLHNVTDRPLEIPITIPGQGAVLNLVTGAMISLTLQKLLRMKPYEILWLSRQDRGTQFMRKLPT